MKKDEAIKELEKDLALLKRHGYNDGLPQALTLAIDTLKRIDVEKMCDFLMSLKNNMTYEQKAQAIVTYLTEGNQ